MKISGSGNITDYIKNRMFTETVPAGKQQEASTNVHREDEFTKVSLSQRSREVLRAQRLINSLPDTRKDLVASIKGRLNEGTYRLDFDQLADTLFKEHR